MHAKPHLNRGGIPYDALLANGRHFATDVRYVLNEVRWLKDILKTGRGDFFRSPRTVNTVYVYCHFYSCDLTLPVSALKLVLPSSAGSCSPSRSAIHAPLVHVDPFSQCILDACSAELGVDVNSR